MNDLQNSAVLLAHLSQINPSLLTERRREVRELDNRDRHSRRSNPVPYGGVIAPVSEPARLQYARRLTSEFLIHFYRYHRNCRSCDECKYDIQ